jgi:hypothetical protein
MISSLKKKYRISFSWGCFLAFLLVMLPNLFWMGNPPAHDILQNNNPPFALAGIIQFVAQVLMIALMCFLVSKGKTSPHRVMEYIACASLLAYYISWVLYYFGYLNGAFILLLAIFPVLFFLMVCIRAENYPALIAWSFFAICHIGITAINFC